MSVSTSSTRSPDWAMVMAMLTATVVLPSWGPAELISRVSRRLVRRHEQQVRPDGPAALGHLRGGVGEHVECRGRCPAMFSTSTVAPLPFRFVLLDGRHQSQQGQAQGLLDVLLGLDGVVDGLEQQGEPIDSNSAAASDSATARGTFGLTGPAGTRAWSITRMLLVRRFEASEVSRSRPPTCSVSLTRRSRSRFSRLYSALLLPAGWPRGWRHPAPPADPRPAWSAAGSCCSKFLRRSRPRAPGPA